MQLQRIVVTRIVAGELRKATLEKIVFRVKDLARSLPDVMGEDVLMGSSNMTAGTFSTSSEEILAGFGSLA